MLWNHRTFLFNLTHLRLQLHQILLHGMIKDEITSLADLLLQQTASAEYPHTPSTLVSSLEQWKVGITRATGWWWRHDDVWTTLNSHWQIAICFGTRKHDWKFDGLTRNLQNTIFHIFLKRIFFCFHDVMTFLPYTHSRVEIYKQFHRHTANLQAICRHRLWVKNIQSGEIVKREA